MELIVVIAIIGVLAAVLIPTFSGAIDSARQASDKSDVTHMNQELMIYKIQENVSSVDYHSALLWLTTNGYSLESSAKGYAYWFDEDAEQLVYAQVDEAISAASANTDGTFYDDPGKIAANKNLTLIDRRTDNPIITAVNGIRNLVQEASSVGSAAGDINAQLTTLFTEIVNEVGNDTVKTYLNHFNPVNTLYITQNGVYMGEAAATEDTEGGADTGETQTPAEPVTATAVVFADTLKVIDKSTTGDTAAYQVQDGAVINLPHTVALVMEGALSCIVPATDEGMVTVTAEKAQFLDDSLSPAVQSASGITTIGKLDELTGSGGSINYTVQYTYKEAVVEYTNAAGKDIQQTIRVKIGDNIPGTDANAENPTKVSKDLNGEATQYTTNDGAKVLREYLVPTFKFTGSFTNVSGIDIQMKKDGDLIVFYGITYGKNGTISQIVTFAFWTNINEGVADYENDKDATTRKYQYTSTDPLRGYSFPNYYENLEIRAYSTETEAVGVVLDRRNEGTPDAPKIIYRAPTSTQDSAEVTYYTVKPDKFTVSSNGLVLYVEYIQQETTASGNTEV